MRTGCIGADQVHKTGLWRHGWESRCLLGQVAGGKVREANIAKWTAEASLLLGVLFPYMPWVSQGSSVTPGSSKGALSLIGFTQQGYCAPHLEPGAGDVDGKRCSSVSGPEKETGQRRCPARVMPGRTHSCGLGPSGLFLSPYRAVGHMMSTMFYPLVTFVLLVICIGYWALMALYPLYSPTGAPGAGRGGGGL